MTNRLKAMLAVRWRAVETRLEQELNDSANARVLAQLAYELRILQNLSEYLPTRKQPAWVLPLFIFVAAVSLVGLAMSFRLPKTKLQLDATASAVSFTAGHGLAENNEFRSGGQIKVTSFEYAGGESKTAMAPVMAIDSMILLPRTQLTLSVDAGRCFLAEVFNTGNVEQVGLGIGLRLLVLSDLDQLLPVPDELVVRPKESVRFCAPDYKDYILAGPVTALDASRVHHEGVPLLLTSSILTGSLQIVDSGQQRELRHSDRVSLAEVDKGYAFVFPGEHLRIEFSGTVGKAEFVGISPEQDRENIAPTVLDVIAGSPRITWLFGIITGLVGTIWSGLRYFGLPSR